MIMKVSYHGAGNLTTKTKNIMRRWVGISDGVVGNLIVFLRAREIYWKWGRRGDIVDLRMATFCLPLYSPIASIDK